MPFVYQCAEIDTIDVGNAIAMAMEGMTTNDKAEKERILNTLVATDAGTNLMHEGFDVDNPDKYTREWFSWANMMFCELVMDYFDIRVEK